MADETTTMSAEELKAEQETRIKRTIVANYFRGIAQAIEEGKILEVRALEWERDSAEVRANITMAEGIEFINMEMKV